jgi:uncharacterized protein
MEATAKLNPTQTVQKNYEHFKNHNIEALLDDLNDDVKWSVPGPKELPWAGVRQGKKEVKEFFDTVFETQEMLKMEPREFIEQDDKLVVLGSWEAKMKKTGKNDKEDWAMAFTFKNGKVSHFQQYSDTYRATEALKQ